MDSITEPLILGGGFAGLSCAVELAAAGRKPVVLEKKPRLGGRAFSFSDPESGDVIDNGQHLFMGCYRETRRFLKTIGTSHLLRFSEQIRVDYAAAEGGGDSLRCPSFLGAPLHLIFGVLALRGLSLSDKLGLWRLDRALRQIAKQGISPELDRVTVREWLDSLGQSRRIQERLFDPIAIGALNDDPTVAAATGMAQVLVEIFFRKAEDSRFGLATVGLSELYVEAAKSFIESRGGKVISSGKAVAILERGGHACGARLESGETWESPAVVSTLAPWELKKLELPAAARGDWERLTPAPIVSICLWLDRPLFSLPTPFIGLLGTEVHWAFDKSRILGKAGGGEHYLALVISGAHKQIGLEPKRLFEIARRDLGLCFPEFQKATIKRWKVVKEPFATLSPVPGSDAKRPRAASGLPGLIFAGDWTQTGLPATIESAVKSGRTAAELILKGAADSAREGEHAQAG